MKNIKIISVATLLICLLITTTLLCACSVAGDGNLLSGRSRTAQPSDNAETKSKDFEFSYYEDISNIVNYATIVKSIGDLSDLFNDESSPVCVNKDEYSQQNQQKILELFQEYNKQFFKDKSLVVISRVRSCMGLQSDIKDYEIVDNSMNVTVSEISKKDADYATAMTMHMCFLEFDKEKVSDVTQINVQEIKEVID
ncbi:MAG: hypothetical protein K2I23_03400 [Clostridia bacterium]|nr:hypothetical protein [Clostridia bacterium]